MSVPRFFKAWYLSVAFFSIIASAACAAEFAGGTGEPNNPYQIATTQQLISIGSDPNLLDKHYVLVNDVDLDPNLSGGQIFTRAVIAPDINETIGFQGTAFTGSLNGDGFRIRNLTIHSDTADYFGLFGVLGPEAVVENLHLESANIVSRKDADHTGVLAASNRGIIRNCSSSGRLYCVGNVGGLVGCNNKQGLIHNCYSTCSVFFSGDYTSDGDMGGLVGYNSGMITNSRACGDVTGYYGLGGLVGENYYEGKISNCYASGNVTGRWYVGGLVGTNIGSTITNSYATGNIYGEPSIYLGGLVGDNSGTIIKCYSTGSIYARGEIWPYGGLAGSNKNKRIYPSRIFMGTIINCFWDTETSGILMSDGGMGLTTSQMMDPEVYSLNGWADEPNWVLDAGNDYPRLAWEEKPGQSIPEPFIDWLHGVGTQDDGPILIDSANQLARIGTASILWDEDFFLVSDLDLTGINLSRIGVCKGTEFTGTFIGGNHVVKNLTIDTNSLPISSLGLFGFIGPEGCVCCLTIQNATIKVECGSEDVGILVGFNQGTIANCSISGSISGGDYSENFGGLAGFNMGTIFGCQANCSISGGGYSEYTGGLVGVNWNCIFACHASGDVTGPNTIGGLVGENYLGARIFECYTDNVVSGRERIGALVGLNKGFVYESFAMGSVIGEDESSALGGLVGDHSGHSIIDCYSTASVSGGNNSSYLGGLVGWYFGQTEITNCYAIGSIYGGEGSSDLGGLIGLDHSRKKDTVMNCFWDIEVSGMSESDGGAGLRTTELQTTATFRDAGWDFVDETDNGTDDIWTICEGKDYPRLQWENVQCEE